MVTLQPLITNYQITHHLLTVALNFSYNKQEKSNKVTNPYTTKVFEYKLAEASENDWKRFDSVLKHISSDF